MVRCVGGVRLGEADGHVRVAVRRHVDSVEPGAGREAGDRDRVLERLAAFGAHLVAVDPGPERVPVAHGLADGGDHLEQEARPLLDRSAVAVAAVVRRGREELVDEVAVARVELDRVHAPRPSPRRGGGELRDDRVDVAVRHLVERDLRGGCAHRRDRRLHLVGRDHRHERIEAGRARPRRHLHRPSGHDVVACDLAHVGELERERRPVAVRGVGEAPDARFEAIVGDAVLALVRGTGRPRDRHGSERHERGAACGARLHVGELAIAHRAVGFGELLAHRRHEDAIAQLERTDAPGRQEVFEGGHEGVATRAASAIVRRRSASRSRLIATRWSATELMRPNAACTATRHSACDQSVRAPATAPAHSAA